MRNSVLSLCYKHREIFTLFQHSVKKKKILFITEKLGNTEKHKNKIKDIQKLITQKQSLLIGIS